VALNGGGESALFCQCSVRWSHLFKYLCHLNKGVVSEERIRYIQSIRTGINVELILSNANVITMNPSRPRADAVVIRGSNVVAVGFQECLSGLRKQETRVIDCRGKTILPGIIDAHFHLLAFAKSLVTLNLEPFNGVHSISHIQARIREVAKNQPPGTWIRGRGYHEFSLAEKRHPTRWDLDEATSIHPTKLTHRSGGAHVLNSSALALVGISKETGDPPEGLIDRDLETGEPTGLLYNMGDDLAKKIPALDPDQMDLGLKRANQELCSMGITTVHDVSARNDRERWDMFETWKKRGLIKPRVKMAFGWEGLSDHRQHPFSSSMNEQQLAAGGVKIILHETTGRLSPGQEELNERVLCIHRAGLQAVLHAVEESAIDAACDAIENALKHVPRPDHRHRIEHCAVCPPSVAKRIASLGITVVTQPPFIYYNGSRYLKTVPGPQVKHLYPFGTLVREGIHVAGSSDGPVVPSNPMIGVYSAVSRKTDLEEGFLPQETILPEEALRMYTTEAARAGFDEMVKGSIAPGKLADLVVLSADPTAVSADEIKEIQVEMTLIDGEIVWEKGA
jgi:predicted amidohydrolase YtcJ